MDADAVDLLGVDSVEGEHPGSTHCAAELRGRTARPNCAAELRGRTARPNCAAELRGDSDLANRAAEAAGLRVRFVKG
jgi:hypothetical protein